MTKARPRRGRPAPPDEPTYTVEQLFALLPVSSKRALDDWRDRAARPFDVNLRTEADGWSVLILDGKEYRFHESAAPGLAVALHRLIARYHGAWHLARTQLRYAKMSVSGGKKSAEARWDSRKRAKLEQQIRGSMLRGEDPMTRAAEWAEALGYTRRHVQNVIREITEVT